jgi:hypothetical protein
MPPPGPTDPGALEAAPGAARAGGTLSNLACFGPGPFDSSHSACFPSALALAEAIRQRGEIRP